MIDLFKGFDEISPLSDSCRLALLDKFRERRILKRQAFLKAGHICRDLSFVESGLLRRYVVRNDKEISCDFASAGHLCIDPNSFFLQKPSVQVIRAINDSVLYMLDRTDYINICEAFPEFRILVDLYIRKNYLFGESLLLIFRTMRAEERYEWMLQHYPLSGSDLASMYFASFLGLTPSTVSRIKRGRKAKPG